MATMHLDVSKQDDYVRHWRQSETPIASATGKRFAKGRCRREDALWGPPSPAL
jgi:hypothetical protein